jgi:HlyD family secretion protein
MADDLAKLRIDRSCKRGTQLPLRRVFGAVIALFLLIAAGVLVRRGRLDKVSTEQVPPPSARNPTELRAGDAVLNATGYVVAAHKIEVASKVVGRVAWIGVETCIFRV